jgi:DNA-directed RNA polymerase subunit RPC12/RpoP
MKEKRKSTKVCPKCGSEILMLLRSMRKKICMECDEEIEWLLEPGQKPLI